VDKLQFGAIKGTCTTHALIIMLHEWLKGTDNSNNKNFVHVVLLDYAKAFDHIDPNILMKKLEAMDIPDPLLRWLESFLTDRKQRVKIGSTLSDWLDIWGTVPQGTLLGVLCFIAMINDLHTDCPTIKYVDDTTIYHVSNEANDNSLQTAVNTAVDWSNRNSMKINASKTKEMMICFSKSPPLIPHITIDSKEIERVTSFKLLGIEINDNLNWNDHIEKVYKKACQRLYFISQLKRTKISSNGIVKVYVTLVRPILEYSCQLWHAGLNAHHQELLESIQERALSMAFPLLAYEDALIEASIPTLSERREELCKRLFSMAQDPTHKLHNLLPPERTITHNQRNIII
jgi:hypothetical protein